MKKSLKTSYISKRINTSIECIKIKIKSKYMHKSINQLYIMHFKCILIQCGFKFEGQKVLLTLTSFDLSEHNLKR